LFRECNEESDDAVDHIQEAITLLGKDLVTLTAIQLDSLRAVALSEELLKLYSVVDSLESTSL
jgi:hypothetical protein